MTSFGAPRDALGNSQAARMLLETLNAEKLVANRLAIIPWKFRVRASEDTVDKRLQANLSSWPQALPREPGVVRFVPFATASPD
jgi:hypothetical protein